MTKNKSFIATLCILLFTFCIFTATAVNVGAAETTTSTKGFNLQMPSGEILFYAGEPIDSIDAVKAYITEQTQISSSEIRLTYNDLQLEEGKTLSDYNIVFGETLQVSFRTNISGKQVNLGGDISMKYYISLTSYTAIEDVSLQITFLGEVSEITDSTYDTTTSKYVFTFKGIPPQCMGDEIDAVLYIGEQAIDSELDYSVKDSLVNIYDESSDAQKQLIIDTLEYGAAAQVYADYKLDALVTDGVSFISDGEEDKEIPENYPTGTSTDGTATVSGNVHFSYINYLKFMFSSTPTAAVEGDVELESENVYRTNGIAPYDFATDYKVKTGTIDFNYSINDYCYAVSQSDKATDNMKALAKALYNYGRSAEALKHAENSEHTNVTYVAEGATIHATCPACGDIGQITLKAPESLVYDGTDKVVTFEGTIQYLTNIAVQYDGDRKNVTDDGFTAYIEIDGVRVELNVELEKADASVTTAPAAVSNLTYTGSAQALVSAGSATGGKLVYSLSDTGEYTDMIPTGTNATTYTVWYKVVAANNNYNDSAVESVTVSIAKADIADATAEAIENQISDNGNAIEPKPVLKFGGATLTEGTDYTLTYSNNTVAGTATITVAGMGNFEGTKELTFTIVDHIHSWTYSASGTTITATCSGTVGTCPNATATATIVVNNGVYTGSAIKTVYVTPGANWEGEITIEYHDNVNVGTATAIIKVNDVKVTEVTFEIKKDPKTDEIDGEWVIIENV